MNYRNLASLLRQLFGWYWELSGKALQAPACQTKTAEKCITGVVSQITEVTVECEMDVRERKTKVTKAWIYTRSLTKAS